jgi:putative phosphoribosyl transferase
MQAAAMHVLFRDRTDAGQRLATELLAYSGQPGVLVLALPRGGVQVAFEVAKALKAPLDVVLVRKLGVPRQADLALGAIATGGVRVLNDHLIQRIGFSEETVDAIAAQEKRELERQEQIYRGQRFRPQIAGSIVILVDDGIATGSTMRAGVTALRIHRPARIIVAVPVAPPSVCDVLQEQVDQVVCPQRSEFFFSLGQWYADFRQVTDEKVQELLMRASQGTVVQRRSAS